MKKEFKSVHIDFLLQCGDHYLQQIHQWASFSCYQKAANYTAKLEAIVELLESITVFHHGNGIHGFVGDHHTPTVESRFKTFDALRKS